MDLRALTRFIKTSNVAIQGISIVSFCLWITLYVVQSREAESNRHCERDNNSIIIAAVSNTSTTTTTAAPLTVVPYPCPKYPNFYTNQNKFIWTYGFLLSIFHLGDQIFLYFAIHHRRIRRTQIFILYGMVTAIINFLLLLYLSVILKFWQAGLLAFNLVPRVIQLCFLYKFLNLLIQSSPRASVINPTSSGSRRNSNEQLHQPEGYSNPDMG